MFFQINSWNILFTNSAASIQCSHDVIVVIVDVVVVDVVYVVVVDVVDVIVDVVVVGELGERVWVMRRVRNEYPITVFRE